MPRELAIKGTHDTVIKIIRRLLPGLPSEAAAAGNYPAVLDIGAGEGALSLKLLNLGLRVSACDLNEEPFLNGAKAELAAATAAAATATAAATAAAAAAPAAAEIDFRRCDQSAALPFEDQSFELALAVEVMEHIDGHDRFLAEVARVLKPGGRFLFTTPNILSLKSRLRFLLEGCFYSFEPLQPFVADPVSQHISPFTLNRYQWLLSLHGLKIDLIKTDKYQYSSMLLAFLIPLIKLSCRLRFGAADITAAQHSMRVLLGRKLIVVARKL